MAINDQSPTYNINSTISTLVSGEKISVAFGKIAKAVNDLISHIANKSNPHGVTKSQIGLENVDNTSDNAKPVSSAQATAIADAKKAGTDAQTNLTNHSNDKNNPHAVTAAQVGAAVKNHTHDGMILYTNQSLTESQKLQARNNIGAVGVNETTVESYTYTYTGEETAVYVEFMYSDFLLLDGVDGDFIEAVTLIQYSDTAGVMRTIEIGQVMVDGDPNGGAYAVGDPEYNFMALVTNIDNYDFSGTVFPKKGVYVNTAFAGTPVSITSTVPYTKTSVTLGSAVLYEEQSLTEEQKTQARGNIGASPLNHTHSEYATADHTHSEYAASSHTHDDRYFTETEVTNKLAGKSDTGHTHDDRYYTESEIDTKLSGKADSGHTHTPSQAGVTTAWLDQNHVHDKQNIKPSAIELTPTGTGVNNGGYIDFHYNQSTSDYTSRIIENASGQLNITGKLNVTGALTWASKAVWGMSNKPNGTYTGNGSATSRTVSIGGTGSVLMIYYSSFVVFVGSGGGAAINFYDGSVVKFTSSEVKLSGGNLTIASTSQFLNQSGRTYGYILL